MMSALGMFLLGLVLLMLGGDSIVKGASGLARRFNISPFVIGLLLVSIATSIPELAVNARAYYAGSQAATSGLGFGLQSLALGNAIGSNIVNFGLTLALAAIAAPFAIRWRALAPMLLCLIVGTIAAIVLGMNGVLSRWEGIAFVLAFVAAIAFAISRSRTEDESLRAEIAGFAQTGAGLGLNLIRVVLALVLLYFGAKFVVAHAPTLGAALGMKPLMTGLIVVAIATALPEVAGAISAARRGQGDMVAGHVIGSSLVNLLLVVGGMAIFRDLPIPASFVKFELPAALAFCLLLYPMLRRDLQFSRAEGWLLFAAFVSWVVFETFLMR